MDDLISIVVPVYNAEKFLERTIENIKRQTLKNWELLLVDDGSVDKSREIMRRYEGEQIRCFYCERNQGPAHARNIGLEYARGRYLAYQDADDLWKPEKLERQLAFAKSTGYAFTFCSYEFADEQGKGNGCVAHAPRRVSYKDFLKSSTLAINTVFIDRTQVPKELLRSPEDAAIEDAATWMQVLRSGVTAYGMDEVLVLYCRHAGTRSGNKWKAVLGKWELYRKWQGFSVMKSFYYLVVNTWNAVRRRMG